MFFQLNRGVYNMGGGPDMRCSAYEFMTKALKLGGISAVEAVNENPYFLKTSAT